MEKLEALGSTPHLFMRDAIAVRSQKTPDQFGNLPEVQAGLKELVP